MPKLDENEQEKKRGPVLRRGFDDPLLQEELKEFRSVFHDAPGLRVDSVRKKIRLLQKRAEIERGREQTDVQINLKLLSDDVALLEAIAKKLNLASRTAAAKLLLEHAITEAADELSLAVTPHDPTDETED